MNYKLVGKISAFGLAGALAIGAISVEAFAAPGAGISNYTKNLVTSSALPTAGLSLAMSECAASVEGEAVLASAQPKVQENDTPVVASEYADMLVATVDDYVNVRNKPSKESKAVGKLYKNNVGTVVKEKDGWYKIESGNVTGWVKGDYVSVGNEKKIRRAGRRVAIVDTETLFVRKGASQEESVIGMVPEGEDLTVVDESQDGWVGVSVDEGDGYVSAEYVTLDTEYTYAESKEEEEARLKREEEERRAAEAAAAAATAASSSSSSSSSGSGSSSSGSSGSSSSTGSSSGGSAYAAPSGSTGSDVANFACQFVGYPYVYGGSSLTNGADCSGFVMAVYAQFGVSLPHSSSALRSVGYGVSTSDMQPGDIVCYSGHVGIYIGGGQIVHASNARDGIKISNASYRTILAVRRIF